MVNRNIDRARTRSALEQARLRVDADADIRDENGSVPHDPSDGELVPAISEKTLAARPVPPKSGPTWNVELKKENMVWTCPNTKIPNRDGGSARWAGSSARSNGTWRNCHMQTSLSLSRGNNYSDQEMSLLVAGRPTKL